MTHRYAIKIDGNFQADSIEHAFALLAEHFHALAEDREPSYGGELFGPDSTLIIQGERGDSAAFMATLPDMVP